MKLFAFGREVAAQVTAHASTGAAMSRVARVEGRTQIGVLHVAAGGILGRHPAAVNQLFLVVAGEGWVAGDDGERHRITPGRAAFWTAGEEHSSGTDTGLIAVVVEARDLDPDTFLTPA